MNSKRILTQPHFRWQQAAVFNKKALKTNQMADMVEHLEATEPDICLRSWWRPNVTESEYWTYGLFTVNGTWQQHYKGKLRKAQLYANVQWNNVSDKQTKVNHTHFSEKQKQKHSTESAITSSADTELLYSGKQTTHNCNNLIMSQYVNAVFTTCSAATKRPKTTFNEALHF